MFSLVFSLFFVLLAHASPEALQAELTAQAEPLGCVAAFALKERGSSASLQKLMICFRPEVLDQGKETELSGCSARLWDQDNKKFLPFAGGPEPEPIFVPEACEGSSIDAMLKMPASESATLDEYVFNAFTLRFRQRTPELTVRRGTFMSEHLTALLDKIDAKYLGSRGHGHIESIPRPAAKPWMPPLQDQHMKVQVHYGTDRKFVPAGSMVKSFSDQRSDQGVIYGIVDVSIPKHHKKGELETPDVFTLEINPSPDRYILVKNVTRQTAEEFFPSLKDRVQQSSKKDLFVFVHGYNVSFEEAARRTAQIAYDLEFAGAPVFYAWPSQSLLRYPVAELNAQWSFPHLKNFLKNIVEKSGAQKIHLIAHSMGNRVLTQALHELATEKLLRASQKFQHVLLTAPDVDADVFRAMEKAIRSVSQTVTIYASDNDKALQVSSKIHSGQRLGQVTPKPVLIPGIETIDASQVNESLLGHSYFGDTPKVINDMLLLLNESLPASARPTLRYQDPLNYWKVLP